MTRRGGLNETRSVFDRGAVCERFWRTVPPIVLCFAVAVSFALGDDPIYKTDKPYDQVTVNEKGGDVVVKIIPLTGLGNPRVVPTAKPGNKKLRVRLLDDEDEQDFEIAWTEIKKIELFEQLILAEAMRFADAKKFDDAFEVIQHVQREHPLMPELPVAINRYLYLAGTDALARRNYIEATSIFEELASRDVDFRPKKEDPAVATLLGLSADPIVASYIEKEDYASAQFVLNRLAKKFALQNSRFYKSWEGKLDKLAAVERDAAKAAVDEQRYTDAYDAAAKMMRIWPDVSGGRELATRISTIYPMVIVGVTMPVSKADPLALENWSARRAGRLTKRLMMDFEKITSEGGQYKFAFGTHSMSDDGIQFVLSPAATSKREISLGLAERLLEMADGKHASFSIPWARAMRSVSVSKAGDVLVDLNYPHVNPPALIQSSIDGANSDVTAMRSPYLMRTQPDGKVTRFVYDPDVPLTTPTQPKEVLERHFPDPPAALLALKRGDVDMIDRIAPDDLAEARSIKEITVDRYATPFIHALVPNMDRRLPASRTARRALMHGIARQAILEQAIMKGTKLPGYRVVSGPFPAPISQNDPLAYAYDERIAPHIFDPLLAVTLLTVSKREIDAFVEKNPKTGSASEKPAEPPKTEPPPEPKPEGEEDDEEVKPKGIEAFSAKVVLAFPGEDMARTTCRAIAQQWKILGVECELKELPPGETTDPSGEYDFLFVELQVWEPVIQASQIVGPQGLGRTISPHVALALRRVESAKNWVDVSAQLRDLHRLVYEDCTVMPLWQVIHFVAYRKGLQGIRKQPASLYDNVLNWKVTPRTLGDR